MKSKQSFRVRVGGRTHDVVVELGGAQDPATVTVDDEPLDVTPIAAGLTLVRSSNGHAQTAVALDDLPLPRNAAARGRAFELDVKSAQAAALEEALAAGGLGSHGGDVIRAPMPGRVVRVLVAVGEEVEADAPVLIVEAMKMENELRCTAGGTVKTISVAEGDTVDAGQVLCEIVAQASD